MREGDFMTEQVESLKRTGYVAKRLGLSQDRVRTLADEGVIPHVRIGSQYRYSPSTIEQWIAEGGTRQNKPT
jgi:excisionase family DNA binding protein